MKICSLSLQNIRQFRDLKLDFTYPIGHAKAGQPLEKVCFIGTNGTGKSTLLELITRVSRGYTLGGNEGYDFSEYIIEDNESIKIKYQLSRDERVISATINNSTKGNRRLIWQKKANSRAINEGNLIDLLIYAPAEGNENTYKKGIPVVTLNEALKIQKDFPVVHSVASDNIKQFWLLLIHLIKKRENDYRNFEAKLENQDKTVREVKAAFEEQSPQILYKLADLWNKILDKAGLEFDAAGAENPIQLTDNLNAYIRLKGTNETIPYTQLSTGIRNFIFRVGHIYSLYFGRAINNGFLLLDEPESSLHPDFLYDLIGIYEGIIQNTQLFVATHNPIIAAQFEPCERFILEFDDQGAVTARKGVMPQGDDPNDLLVYDFGVRNLLGEEGQKKWERFVELQQLIMQEQDREVKRGLLREWMKIGNAYKFDVNEIPQ